MIRTLQLHVASYFFSSTAFHQINENKSGKCRNVLELFRKRETDEFREER